MPGFKLLTPALVALPLALTTVHAETRARFEHAWSDASKQAVGTAFGQQSSKVWFTVGHGILNEVYYPRIDRAQVGDSQLLFTDGDRFLEEKRDFSFAVAHPARAPRVTLKARGGQKDPIAFTKEVLADPARPVVRVRYHFDALPEGAKIFVLHKPAAGNDGAHDQGRLVFKRPGAVAFLAFDDEAATDERAYQAVITSRPVLKASVGVVGESDGWQDISRNGRMTREIAQNSGNLAYTAEVAAGGDLEVLIGFGPSPDEALTAAVESLREGFERVRDSFDEGWDGYAAKLAAAPWLAELPAAARQAVLWDALVVKAHEDKLNPGAIVASLSIPNLPEGRGAPDGKNTGGYHLVWPRDLFKSALSLLRLGDLKTALDVLRFMSRMEHDGKIAQNAWVDGRPFWTGEQMDEEAFPVLLAQELTRAGADLGEFAGFLDRRLARLRQSGGRTGQERWEEAGGYSPNTIAIMAAALARAGDADGASRMLEIALSKTVSRQGPLSRSPYFIRISATGEPDAGHYLQIANGGPALPEYRILDGGFLEWVRWFPQPERYFGSRGAELATAIRDTLPLYDDAANGVATSLGGVPLYRRYNSDAYGVDHVGGPWPILTLERALPELAQAPAAGLRYLAAVHRLYGAGDMCPEQLLPGGAPMPFAASPLVWCHAEMVELAYRAVAAKLDRR